MFAASKSLTNHQTIFMRRTEENHKKSKKSKPILHKRQLTIFLKNNTNWHIVKPFFCLNMRAIGTLIKAFSFSFFRSKNCWILARSFKHINSVLSDTEIFIFWRFSKRYNILHHFYLKGRGWKETNASTCLINFTCFQKILYLLNILWDLTFQFVVEKC